MKVKLDENMPARLARVFARHGRDVGTVREEGLAGRQGEFTDWESRRSTVGLGL